ncbi:hypothetical protein HYFRA_00001342 [Hymenoscyphus fraxineus]|uniref:Uncharacterized protein n=1 Tax=Hymenoscyphus fraxineus TaxID=746836 RepID=A0A9N9L4Q8_9HELO|nr:hypothetical protein HYFRA_00001342 [Hymenoscyphus fraxineus]
MTNEHAPGASRTMGGSVEVSSVAGAGAGARKGQGRLLRTVLLFGQRLTIIHKLKGDGTWSGGSGGGGTLLCVCSANPVLGLKDALMCTSWASSSPVSLESLPLSLVRGQTMRMSTDQYLDIRSLAQASEISVPKYLWGLHSTLRFAKYRTWAWLLQVPNQYLYEHYSYANDDQAESSAALPFTPPPTTWNSHNSMPRPARRWPSRLSPSEIRISNALKRNRVVGCWCWAQALPPALYGSQDLLVLSQGPRETKHRLPISPARQTDFSGDGNLPQGVAFLRRHAVCS